MLFGAGAFAVGTMMTGKPVKELRSEIKDAIGDKARRKEILAMLDQWDKSTKPLLKRHREIWDQVEDQFEEHDGQRADFEKLFSAADETNLEALQKGIEGRRAFRNALTKDEWDILFAEAR
jgi:hypothetical protein